MEKSLALVSCEKEIARCQTAFLMAFGQVVRDPFGELLDESHCLQTLGNGFTSHPKLLRELFLRLRVVFIQQRQQFDVLELFRPVFTLFRTKVEISNSEPLEPLLALRNAECVLAVSRN